jgi:hypothetical protein
MLATEAGRQRALLERIVQRRLGREEVAHRQKECRDELLEEERAGYLSERCHFANPSGTTKRPWSSRAPLPPKTP